MNDGGIITWVVIGGFILGVWTINHQSNQISQLRDMVTGCSSTIDDANDTIDTLNSDIEDAQSEAWSDYDTMGSTLEDLETQDGVDNNCYDPTKNN